MTRYAPHDHNVVRLDQQTGGVIGMRSWILLEHHTDISGRERRRHCSSTLLRLERRVFGRSGENHDPEVGNSVNLEILNSYVAV